jgi:putative addiction module killer protein
MVTYMLLLRRCGKSRFRSSWDFGPGYRVYFGKDGERLVILVGGSAKKRQGAAIAAAQATWAEYRRRRGGKEHGTWH